METSNSHKENKILLIAFYMFGIGGLVAWNAILAILDFFIHFQSEYSPEFVYPMMNFVLNLVFQFLLVFIGNKFSYKIQILSCLVLSGVSLVLMPIVVYCFQGLFGFLLTSFIILFQGFANAVLLSGLYGIASFLPFKYVIAMNTGQGFSGVIMNLVRYIVIFSLKNADDDSSILIGAVIFFTTASLIIIVDIYFIMVIYKDPFFISQLANSGEFAQEKIETYKILEDDEKTNLNSISATKEGKSDFSKVLTILLDVCFLMSLNYLITFIVFPAVSIQGKLFSLSPALNINTLIIIFNMFDTIGRYGPNILRIDKSKIAYLVFSRFIFLITFSLTYICKAADIIGFFTNSYFVIINMAIFSITNGFTTSSLFSIAPGLVPNELKGKSGSTLSLFLILGIFTGTLYALFIIKNII